MIVGRYLESLDYWPCDDGMRNKFRVAAEDLTPICLIYRSSFLKQNSNQYRDCQVTVLVTAVTSRPGCPSRHGLMISRSSNSAVSNQPEAAATFTQQLSSGRSSCSSGGWDCWAQRRQAPAGLGDSYFYKSQILSATWSELWPSR